MECCFRTRRPALGGSGCTGRNRKTAYRSGLTLHQQLAADSPKIPEYRQELARSHNNLGDPLKDAGRATEAETAFRAALFIRQQMVAESLTVPEFRQGLANSHNSLGILLQDTGRLQDAETAYREALVLPRQLAADFPAVSDPQNNLAGTMVKLNQVMKPLAKTGKCTELGVFAPSRGNHSMWDQGLTSSRPRCAILPAQRPPQPGKPVSTGLNAEGGGQVQQFAGSGDLPPDCASSGELREPHAREGSARRDDDLPTPAANRC